MCAVRPRNWSAACKHTAAVLLPLRDKPPIKTTSLAFTSRLRSKHHARALGKPSRIQATAAAKSGTLNCGASGYLPSNPASPVSTPTERRPARFAAKKSAVESPTNHDCSGLICQVAHAWVISAVAGLRQAQTLFKLGTSPAKPASGWWGQ